MKLAQMLYGALLAGLTALPLQAKGAIASAPRITPAEYGRRKMAVIRRSRAAEVWR